jgi:hypothetical protein
MAGKKPQRSGALPGTPRRLRVLRRLASLGITTGERETSTLKLWFNCTQYHTALLAMQVILQDSNARKPSQGAPPNSSLAWAGPLRRVFAPSSLSPTPSSLFLCQPDHHPAPAQPTPLAPLTPLPSLEMSSPQSPTHMRQTNPNPLPSPSLIHSLTFPPNFAG